jgi:hypothetical protein
MSPNFLLTMLVAELESLKNANLLEPFLEENATLVNRLRAQLPTTGENNEPF